MQASSVANFNHLMKLNNNAGQEEVKKPVKIDTSVMLKGHHATGVKTVGDIANMSRSRSTFETQAMKFERLMREQVQPYNKRLLKDPTFRDFY